MLIPLLSLQDVLWGVWKEEWCLLLVWWGQGAHEKITICHTVYKKPQVAFHLPSMEETWKAPQQVEKKWEDHAEGKTAMRPQLRVRWGCAAEAGLRTVLWWKTCESRYAALWKARDLWDSALPLLWAGHVEDQGFAAQSFTPSKAQRGRVWVAAILQQQNFQWSEWAVLCGNWMEDWPKSVLGQRYNESFPFTELHWC